MRCNNKVAVLDVDGVLLDCSGGFERVASRVLGRPMLARNKAYRFDNRFGLTPTEVDRVWREMEASEDGWRGLPAYPGAAEAVARLRSNGYAIHLVTAISEHVRQHRLDCLVGHAIQADEIHCVGIHGDKGAIIASINPVMFVDDRLSHLHEAPGVPYRVFVDLDHDQDGLVVDEEIIYTRSLRQWVASWEMVKGYGRRAA